MRHAIRAVLFVAAAALVNVPMAAHAQGEAYVAPFMGVNFANNSGNGRANFGVNAGWTNGGIIGAELDFGYAPSFFGNQGTFGSNYVMDLMGNLIVGVPAGSQNYTAGVRPYGTIGFGLMRSQVNAGPTGTTQISNNDPGINAGAGVMGFLSPHVGLRGDVRYFRDVHNTDVANGFGIDFGSFHFWRASFGVIIR
jgi:hypothetical protein